MLDFDLTEEQRLLEASVREWGAREVQPKIHDLDREHRFDRAIFPQMAQLGLLGASVPAEYGGAGMDYVSLGIISEELEYVDTSLRVIMSVHAGLNCLSLLTWGTEAQKQKYLVPQAQGQKIATYGLTEPAAGSDVRGMQTTAVKKGDRYFITGEKMWISLADVADNFLVFGWTDAEKKKQKDPSGISAFIVERGFKGFSSGTLKEKWGILAGNTGYFKMDDMEVPEENLLGKEGAGSWLFTRSMTWERGCILASAVGTMQRLLETCIRYANERKQGGQSIGKFQQVATKIVDMKLRLESARHMLYHGAWAAGHRKAVYLEAAMAKLHISDCWVKCCEDAIQIHGGYGYMVEYEVERELRDAIGSKIYSGTCEIQRNILASLHGL
jgi:glutaryl-CoA dehydrogenase (non-decarboxylating)